MNILTNENLALDVNLIPNKIEDVRYCIFDTHKDKKDFYFLPIVFMEAWTSPAAELKIGEFTITVPMDWSLVTCDEEYTGIEVIPLTSTQLKGSSTLVYNPMSTFVPDVKEVTLSNVYMEVKWFFPATRQGSLVVIPLEKGHKPKCVLFMSDKSKVPDHLDISELF